MDIYKCPKSETQKNFPNKNFNILNNKLKKELKAENLLIAFLDSSYKLN
jgi:hypothetical protein